MTGKQDRTRSGGYFWWALLFLCLSGLHLTTVSSEFGGNLGGDNIVYFLLGKALVTGQGYVDLYLPGHPPHDTYPFVFPFLLAPFHLIFRDPLPAMHIMVVLFNAAAATILGIWAGRRFDFRWAGYLFAILFGTMPLVYLQSGHLLSEPVYMFFCYLALLIVPETKGTSLSKGRLALICITVLAAYFTRAAGLALAASLCIGLYIQNIVMYPALRKFPPWLIMGIVFGVGAVAWAGRSLAYGGAGFFYMTDLMYKDYAMPWAGTTSLGDLLVRFPRNMNYYFPFIGSRSFGPAWGADSIRWLYLSAGYLIFALAILGAGLELKRGRVYGEIFTLLSLTAMIVWPYRDYRFVLPVIPLCGYYVFNAIFWLASFVFKRMATVMVLALLLVVALLSQGYVASKMVRDRFKDGWAPRRPVYVEGYGSWIDPVINWANYDIYHHRERHYRAREMESLTYYLIMNKAAGDVVPEESIILSRKPMSTYFFSGRKCVPLIQDPRPDRQWQYLMENNVDYIVLGRNEDSLKRLMVERHQSFQEVMYIIGTKARLLKIVKEPGWK